MPQLQASPRVNCPFQATGQFFHSQCIQSMEPNIPENHMHSPFEVVVQCRHCKAS
ncbi:hypothetical protein Fmac_002890 [Flemingia macrophylla]|uniref:Uncharacterized protein n=1 Tax=Flemingia macrophylla TaxID=520843 RepID=A0ABD1NP35_9FABA